MIPKIFILHSSDIVRKGLSGIIRNQFQAEVTELSDARFLPVGELAGSKETVFFIEDKFLKTTKIIEFIAEQNVNCRTVAVSICENSGEKTAFHISIHSNAALISKMLDEILSGTQEKSVEHEGEELTQREQDVLKLVALGFPNKIIAEKLFISIHTVISHRKNITEKLGIKSISGLTVYAILNHLIDTSEINPQDLI